MGLICASLVSGGVAGNRLRMPRSMHLELLISACPASSDLLRARSTLTSLQVVRGEAAHHSGHSPLRAHIDGGAKVGHLQNAARQQQILRLQVPVQDALRACDTVWAGVVWHDKSGARAVICSGPEHFAGAPTNS